MKLITIPLREFALPSPRTGSIEAHSGFSRAMAEGQEIHQRVQRRRVKADPLYKPEVSVSGGFEREGFRFQVEGRMDGLFRHERPVIEEIKSTFNVRELARRLTDRPLDHPYCLQLLTYGYIYWLQNHVIPKLTFHLVSTRNYDSEDLELTLDIAGYEKWLELRLQELVLEAQIAEKRGARRRKVAADFTFPFALPRPGQVELIRTIEEGMGEGRPMLIQAPTGLGKTVGVLYPVLREALSRGQQAIYVTPKNSQHSVAEDAVHRFQETGAKIKSLSITAKGKICFKNEPLCNPDYCEYARDYYGKVQRLGLIEILGKKKKLKARTFRKLGEEHQVCPFELQLDSVEHADLVICDYNYVFAPTSALGRLSTISIDQSGKPNLVIDEAHNLPARSIDYYSPSLSSVIIEQLRESLRKLPARLRKDADELVDGCQAVISGCRGKHVRPSRIEPPMEAFLEQDVRLRSFLSRYLESDQEIEPKDPVLRLCFYWSEFTETLEYLSDPEHDEFFATYHPHPTGGILKITCCDASAMLHRCYDDYQQVVAFSATLKPFEYYAKLSGLDLEKVKSCEFIAPFPKENRKLLIIPQISTKYSDREKNYGKIADAINRIATLRDGNYFVFLPSFDFLERVSLLFNTPHGFMVVKQERSMKMADVDSLLEHLQTGGAPTIVFAVQGGSLSEGVDYAGDMVIGAFVVGPPLPNYDLEREGMRDYYQRHYNAGFEYAYTIPAMAKAIQAAGRVIRSEADRGLIVLMDGRFLESGYGRSMPADWFVSNPAELVSSAILQDVTDFWNRNPDM